MPRCKGCSKDFNPVEALMGPLCGECVRDAHRHAVGELSTEELRERQKVRRMSRRIR